MVQAPGFVQTVLGNAIENNITRLPRNRNGSQKSTKLSDGCKVVFTLAYVQYIWSQVRATAMRKK
jgi:hypothetical protein